MVIKVVAAGAVTASFGILFNIRGKKIVYAALCGLIGYFVYELCIDYNKLLAFFLSSMVMALFAEIMARILQSPASLFLVSGLIPIVPGGGMFSFVLKAMEGNLSEAASIGGSTLLEAGTIAVGIIFASSFMNFMPFARNIPLKLPRKRASRREMKDTHLPEKENHDHDKLSNEDISN